MRTSLLVASAPLLGLLLGACGEDKDGPTSASNTVAVTGVVGVGGAGGEGGAGGLGGAGGNAAAECDDGELNGDETDVDCGGGVCPDCLPGQGCSIGEDCETDECNGGVCAGSSCTDGVRNGGESDVDCGGACDPCDLGQDCEDPEDCVTGVCAAGVCANPGCTDGIQNGTETGVDCGGADCNEKCPGGQGCNNGDDCQSTICDLGECTTASCSDGVRNGEETDQDCGGPDCNECRAGQACEIDGDCLSLDCSPQDQCLCPEAMVTVPVLGGGAYCVDQAEITYEQYDAFMDANPQFDIPECEFNTGVDNNYTPSQSWPPNDDDPGAENFKWKPVRYVDWCDAMAYCRWDGKRLCGAIEGGPLPISEIGDPSESQWYNACSNQGTNTYPYGNTYSPFESCQESVNGAQNLPQNVRVTNGYVDVCEGGVQSLHQMSGNLAEWEDACAAATGATDQCPVRGGSFLSSEIEDLTCTGPLDGQDPPQPIPVTFPRETRSAEIGFRCCQ